MIGRPPDDKPASLIRGPDPTDYERIGRFAEAVKAVGRQCGMWSIKVEVIDEPNSVLTVVMTFMQAGVPDGNARG